MKILHLTLTKEPFETMEQMLKDREYRINLSTNWIKSRLIDSKTGKDKPITHVKFTHGYGSDKPYFICRYHGYEIAKKNYTVKYSNGFSVDVKKGMYRILLGSITRKGNIYSQELFN